MLRRIWSIYIKVNRNKEVYLLHTYPKPLGEGSSARLQFGLQKGSSHII